MDRHVPEPDSYIINHVLVRGVSEDVKGRRKSDSREVEEWEKGSVSIALESQKKHRLTGEPVRIDRPTSSFR